LLIIYQIFGFTIGVRQLQVCREFTTKFATFVRATCFVNSLKGGTVGRATDRTCDHICDLSWI